MKKLLFSLIVYFLPVCTLFAYTEKNLLQQKTSEERLKELLVLHQQWVAYPDYTDRQGWDALFGEFKDVYIRRGEKALEYRWQVIQAMDYIEYERSGSRKIMENPYNENAQTLTDLFLAELAEGKGRFIETLANGVFYFCEMTSWALSAHVRLQHDNRTLPNHGEHVIALASGEVGAELSWIHYFFRDELDKINPVISQRVRDEVEKRILKTYLETDHFWWMAMNYKPGDMVNNWNPWCNFSVLQCFMLLENDTDRLAKAVYKTIRSVDHFINYSKADGACEEGPSYWGHAAGKLYDYLQLLCDVTGGQLSLFEEPLIRRMGEYISRSYVGNGWVVNFADATARLEPDADLIYRYGKAVNSTEMMAFSAFLRKNEQAPQAPNNRRDVYRTFETLRFHHALSTVTLPYSAPATTWYPETQFCYMRTRGGLFFAGKGGHNNESHNHNDVGTFSLYIDETPVLIDAGVGTYTRQTFGDERYTIWTMQSLFHNLPEINGTQQAFGAKYKAEQMKFTLANRSLSLELKQAYPQETSIQSWNRTYRLQDKQLEINDRFSLESPEKRNKLHFLTWGRVDRSIEGQIDMEVQGKKARLSYDRNIFTSSVETITLTDPRLSNVWGKELYRITLEAKELSLSGHYRIVISRE